MPYSLGGIRRNNTQMPYSHAGARQNKQNGTIYYARELDSKLMYAWSWAFKNRFNNSSLHVHCLWKTRIFLMHKCIKYQYKCFYKRRVRDAINLKWSSQVLSSLFRTNLRELTLSLSKNSDSTIDSNLSKRDRKQDPSIWVGMMTTDAHNLVYFLEMLCCCRTIMLDP